MAQSGRIEVIARMSALRGEADFALSDGVEVC